MLPLSLTQVFLPEGLAGVFSSLLQQPGFKKIVQFWFSALLTLSKFFLLDISTKWFGLYFFRFLVQAAFRGTAKNETFV